MSEHLPPVYLIKALSELISVVMIPNQILCEYRIIRGFGQIHMELLEKYLKVLRVVAARLWHTMKYAQPVDI